MKNLKSVFCAAVCIAAALLVFSFAGTLRDLRGADDAKKPGTEKAPPPAAKLVPLNKQATVLLDKTGTRLLLKTKVVLREGALEMLCCPSQTKEHESILAVESSAHTIHAGLLALGAEPGGPVQYLPEYKPPQGQQIEIFLEWDAKGKHHRVRAQEWIRYSVFRFFGKTLEQLPADLTIPKESELRWEEKFKELSWYGPMTAAERDKLTALSTDAAYRAAIDEFFEKSQSRAMEADWVFVGSGFFTDPDTGKQIYQAEVGDLICVANFPSATVDVAVASSAQGTANLLYEAYTDRIPPIGTEVTLELRPVFEKGATSKEKGPTSKIPSPAKERDQE